MIRMLGFLFRLGLVVGFIVTGIVLEWVAGEKLVRAELARKAPEKQLRQVLGEDGPAWIRVRLEPASAGRTLTCAGVSCLWTRREGFKTVIDDIKRDGKWTKRERRQFFRDNPVGVPFNLVDGQDVIGMDDWIGVEVAHDLMQMRADENAIASEASSEKPLPIVVRETFLAAGADAWGCGEFKNGRAQGYIGGTFILTGLGRDRWARECEGNALWWLWIGRGMLLLAAVVLWRAVRALLHSEPDQATLSAPADGPNSAKEPPHA